MAVSCGRRSTRRSCPAARSRGRLARSAPRRSALLVLLVSALLGLTPARAATGEAGQLAPVTSATGWTWVSSDGHGALLLTTSTRILRLQRDSSYTVVAGTDVECGGYGTPACGIDGPVAMTAIHPLQVEADPASDDIYFREGLTVRRVRDGRVQTVFNASASTCDGVEPCGDGGPALDARPSTEPMIAIAPDGRLHILDGQRVRRVETDGTIDTVAAVPELGITGAFDISASGEMVVGGMSGIWRRTTGAFERITMGDCSQPPDPCGDGGPVAQARVLPLGLDFDAHGRLYVRDRDRVRVIDVDGTVRHVTGSWQSTGFFCGQPECATSGLASEVPIEPYDIATDGDDLVITTAYIGHLLRVSNPLALPASPPQGYRMIGSDGGVFTFGWSTFHGSTGALRLVSPIVAGVSNGRGGYWFVAGDGGVFTFGDVGYFGSAAGKTDSPVVDMAVSDDRQGYAILERDGSVQSFNRTFEVDRPDFGAPSAALVRIGPGRLRIIAERPSSLPPLKAPIVHARPTPGGNGLWLVAADGGVFTQGDAGFFGSTGALRLNQPVVDLVPTPTGNGYWLIARDGGVFTFGDARFFGSMGGVRLNRPVVAGIPGPVSSG